MKTKHLIILFFAQLFSVYYLNAQTVYYDNQAKLYGIINSKGIDILKPTYVDLNRFENGLGKFKINGKWGLIDEKGKVVIKPNFESSDDFGLLSEGLIALKKNGKWGYVNLKGEIVIDFIYDWTMQFCGGIAWVTQNGKYNFIDTKGKLISNIWFYDIFISKGVSYANVNGVVDEAKIYEITVNGIKRTDSDFIMGTRMYCDIPTNQKLIRFRANDNSPYGYRDQNNKLVIEPKYGFATDFDSGVALVMKKNISSGFSDCYIIDEKGSEFFQLNSEWETINGTDMAFHNGLLELHDKSKGDRILINIKGEVVKRMNN